MRNKLLFAVIMGLATLFINSRTASSQSSTDDEEKFEVGAQFSVLHSAIRQTPLNGIVCIPSEPCPMLIISSSREWQPGFGGRVGYNLTTNLAVEAEVNFFPKADSFRVPEAFGDGNKLEGLFGVKAGKRFDEVGVFAKARPGFLHTAKGDIRLRPDVCLALTVLPPPAGCFETISNTNFALDLGGVLEVYPTKRTIIRFDAGDTIIRLSERNLFGLRIPAETTHNFQLNVGVGFRF